MEAEKQKGIPIQLDRLRHLIIDMAAVARFEYISGKPLFCVKTWERLSREDTALLLWVSLVAEDRGLRPKDMLNILKSGIVDEKAVAEKLKMAWGTVINSFLEEVSHDLNR
jgi:hypothetical protein